MLCELNSRTVGWVIVSQVSNEVCTSILQNIRTAVSPECYKAWFKDLNVIGLEDSLIRITAPNRYVKQWLDSHYKKELMHAVSASMPEITEIQLAIAAVGTSNSADSSSLLSEVLNQTLPAQLQPHENTVFNQTHSVSFSRNDSSHRVLKGSPRFLPFSPKLRLETFSVGKCNRIAHAAAQTVAETPALVYNPLFLHGEHGSGKTHLLQGIGQLIAEHFPKLNIAYISCEEFTNAYVTAVQLKHLDVFRHQFRSCDVLLMDDVQFLAGKEKTQEEFFHTFDALRHGNKQVILCADQAPRDIKRLDPRLIARFQSGLVARLDAPEQDLRVAVVREKARIRGLNLSPDVAVVLATHIVNNVRELEGAVCKLMALAASESRAPDRELALLALRELGYLHTGPLTLSDILNSIVQKYGVSADEIRSDKRHASLVHVRHLGMYLSKMLTSHSGSEIGQFYGNRDHTTVIHASRKIATRGKRDENLRHEIQVLRQILGR